MSWAFLAHYVAKTDLTHFRIFPRNLEPDFTHYFGEQRKENGKSMNDHDSATIVITFLLLLPWLGRTAASAMAVWRARSESQTKKAIYAGGPRKGRCS